MSVELYIYNNMNKYIIIQVYKSSVFIYIYIYSYPIIAGNTK